MLVIGSIITFLAFFIGVPALKENIMVYVEPFSFILVLGGTIGATCLSAEAKDMKGLGGALKQLIFKPKRMDSVETVKILVEVSEIAQTKSKADLAVEGEGIGDGFLERGLTLVGAGLDADFIRKAMEADIAEMQQRHTIICTLIRTMGSYAPMFGMTGTVLGVTQVLQNVTDINNIVAGMSLALLTTLYGLVMSTIFFIPVTNKLKGLTAKEALTKEIITEGIQMIIEKEIPLKVEKYLTAYLERKDKDLEAAK